MSYPKRETQLVTDSHLKVLDYLLQGYTFDHVARLLKISRKAVTNKVCEMRYNVCAPSENGNFGLIQILISMGYLKFNEDGSYIIKQLEPRKKGWSNGSNKRKQ